MGGDGRIEGSYSPVAIVYENSARQSAAISDLQTTLFRSASVVLWLALSPASLFSRCKFSKRCFVNTFGYCNKCMINLLGITS